MTRTAEQPHTTVMAFLSTQDDDIFIISFPSTFKVQQLQRNPSCCFAIDERANFTFDKAIQWNYTLIDAIAHIDSSHQTHQIIHHGTVTIYPDDGTEQKVIANAQVMNLSKSKWIANMMSSFSCCSPIKMKTLLFYLALNAAVGLGGYVVLG